MNILGSSYPIHDAVSKAIGSAIYAGDMKLKGMLYGAVIFSSIPHGIVKQINVSKALEMPGVVDIVHCFNTTQNLFNRYRTLYGDNPIPQERVFNDHVRFIGDRIGCIIAEKPEIARAAAKLVEITYEELPFSVDMREVIETGINSCIHEEGAVYGDFEIELGDKSKVLSDTVKTTTKSFLSRIHHMTMETHAAVADYDRGLDELTIWSPNQSIFSIRTIIGDLFDMPYHKIRVIKTTMGGSFGAKQEWILEPVAAAAALKVGKPVKIVYNRKEQMASTISRTPIDAVITSEITKDGKIQSFDADFTLDAGAYLGNSYDYAVAVSSKFYRFYNYPYVHYKGRAVCTNGPVSGAFRGWATPELYIALEHNLNMAARELNICPVELRLKNAAMPGDVDKKTGQSLGEIRAKECIELGRDRFNWHERVKLNKEFNESSKRYKRGAAIACGGHVNGYFPRRQDFTGVEMRMTESGSVIVNVTLHDHGCGSITAFKMLAAENLGIPVDMIRIDEPDSLYAPMDMGCFASRTVYVIGKAVVDCAELLKRELIRNVSALTGTLEQFLYIENAVVKSKLDSSISYSYSEASVASIRTLQREVWVKHQYLSNSNPAVSSAHFAQVEVDTYTGMVKILDYLAVHDIGKVINREICKGQVQGATLMGAGAALTEDGGAKPNGMPINSIKDYHLLNAFDAPSIEVLFIEDGGDNGPYGAKSIGEVAHVAVAPAIVGAVNNALDSELCNLPLTPDKIMAMLREREGAVQ